MKRCVELTNIGGDYCGMGPLENFPDMETEVDGQSRASNDVWINEKDLPGTLQDAWNAVRAFHIAFGHPAPEKPEKQHILRAAKRAEWIDEELDELVGAQDITEQADAYLDIIYFALGGLVELGIEPSAIFDMVQRANMAKLGPDGKPIYHPDGKVKKPEGWVAPDDAIRAHIEGLME